MRRARFWMGVAIVMSPFMGLLLAEYGNRLTPCPTVDGRLTYNGQPIRNRWVTLSTPDRRLSSDLIGCTDREGYFRCNGPSCWVPNGDRVAFRIRVYPDPRRSQRAPEREGWTDVTESGSSTLQGGDSEGHRRVKLASFSTGTSARSAVRGDLRTIGGDSLNVTLGPEPAHLDIDLKD